MDYLNINRQLLEQLAEITASMERITKEEHTHPLDKDLLLSQIKELYATALKIEAKTEGQDVVESTEDFVQEGPQTIDPSKMEVAPQAEEPEAEPETPAENTHFEPLQKPVESTPEPEPAAEPELPQDEEPEITPEPETSPELIPPMYGPIPEDFKEVQPQDSDEEETPEPEHEPEPVYEPVAQKEENQQNITEIVMSRKSAIENIVSQQHTIKAAHETTPQPQAETHHNDHSQSNEEQPQLSLLDYLSSGVSRVVETVAPQPQKPEPATHTDTLNTPAPAQTPTPEPTPTPVVPQQTPTAPAAPKFTDLRSLIGINDKFTFINDLFEKDMRNYNEFINTLNKIEDLGEAQSFVQQNATIHNWDKESMAVQLFMSVYKRRFSAPLILA